MPWKRGTTVVRKTYEDLLDKKLNPQSNEVETEVYSSFKIRKKKSPNWFININDNVRFMKKNNKVITKPKVYKKGRQFLLT